VQDDDLITRHFEQHRPQLQAVAYRMLGSVTEADDAVQEAWLRLQRSDTSDVDNLGAWLTTVVSRVCLNVLRARAVRRAEPLDEVVERLPDMVVSFDPAGPEDAAALADSVGLALLVVLDALAPAERLAFVLHDMFGVPFDEIAAILDRSEAATRQLASRARRRVRGAAPTPDRDLGRQREVVDAFFAAARGGDFDRLVAVLHPDVVVRTDAGPGAGPSVVVRGASVAASRAASFSDEARVVVPVLVNGGPGVVITKDGQVVSVMAFTVVDGRIVEIDSLADPERLASVQASLDGTGEDTV
jgi:RNA polymerase sigma factor (sigma-70 family)